MLWSASQITGSIGIMVTECNRTTEIELAVKFRILIRKQIKKASVNESSLVPGDVRQLFSECHGRRRRRRGKKAVETL